MSPAASCRAPHAGAIRAHRFARPVWAALAVAVSLGGPLVSGEARSVPIAKFGSAAHRSAWGNVPVAASAIPTPPIAPPSNHLHVMRVIPHLNGTIAFELQVPGPGKINILETASYNDASVKYKNTASIANLTPAPDRFAYARRLAWANGRTMVWIRVVPNKHGHWLLHHHAHPVTLRIRIAYTPRGGHGRIVTVYHVTLTQAGGPEGRLAVSGQIRLRTSFAAAGTP